MTDEEVILNRTELAEKLRVSPETVWRYTVNGVIPSIRIGTAYRYRFSDVIAALQSDNPVRRRRKKR